MSNTKSASIHQPTLNWHTKLQPTIHTRTSQKSARHYHPPWITGIQKVSKGLRIGINENQSTDQSYKTMTLQL